MKQVRHWRRRLGKIFPAGRRRFSNVPLDQAKYVTLYHGTSKKNIPRIMEKGLIPSGELAKGYSYLTPSKSAAIMHARAGPEGDGSYIHSRIEQGELIEDPTILKITVPKTSRMLEGVYFEPAKFKERYELLSDEIIPPSQIEEMNINKLLKRAYSESLEPEKVGRNYTPVVKKFKKSDVFTEPSYEKLPKKEMESFREVIQ